MLAAVAGRLKCSEKADGFAAGTGVKALFDTPVRDIDHVYGAIALAGDKQLIAAKRHVHRLRPDLDRGLLAERRIDHAYRVAVEAGDADQTVVGGVTGDLRGLGYVLENHFVADHAGL